MLCQHFIGMKYSVIADASFDNAAATLFEKVRQNPRIDHRNTRDRVGHRESNCQPIGFLTPLLDQSTQTKRLFHGGSFLGNLRRTDKEYQIASECLGYQNRG